QSLKPSTGTSILRDGELWGVRLTATAGGRSDSATVAVRDDNETIPTIHDASKPPMMPTGERPYLAIRDARDASSDPLLERKAMNSASLIVWKIDMRVVPDMTLEVEPESLPGDVALFLDDLASERTIRLEGNERLDLGSTGARRFALRAVRGGITTPPSSRLLTNYPNPFNPETWIPFELSEGAEVTVRIYDLQGQVVKTLLLGQRSAGTYLRQETAAYWDGRNELGESVASGTYIYDITAGSFRSSRKMVLLK
ncbi:MAG: T9SS type A sorting domain-containing protein, partial [Candidatus Poribacteria bacterium]|nr:T9SS type A sorting domain-containing protein [Candidatus Poribacteria bacterium]